MRLNIDSISLGDNRNWGRRSFRKATP